MNAHAPAVTVTVANPARGISESNTFADHASADDYAARHELMGYEVSMRAHDHRLVSTPDGTLITIPHIPSGAVALTASAMIAAGGFLLLREISLFVDGGYFGALTPECRERARRVLVEASEVARLSGAPIGDILEYTDGDAEAVSVAATETI